MVSMIFSFVTSSLDYLNSHEQRQQEAAWINMQLLPKLKHKKEVFKKWKQGWDDPGEIWGLQEWSQKSQSNPELSLVQVCGRWEGILHEQQREDKGKCAPAAEWTQSLVTKDMGRAEVLNVFFCLRKAHNICLQASEAPATRGKVWSNEDFLSGQWWGSGTPAVDTHRYMGPNRVQQRVLRELADVPSRPLSKLSLKSHSNCKRFLMTGRKQGELWSPSVKKAKKKNPGNHKQVSLTLISPEHKKTVFCFLVWSNTARACTEALQNLHLWRYSTNLL